MTRVIFVAALMLSACGPPEPTCSPGESFAECDVGMSPVCVAPDGTCAMEIVGCDRNGLPRCGPLGEGYSSFCTATAALDCMDREPPVPEDPQCQTPGGDPLAAPSCPRGELAYCVTAGACSLNTPVCEDGEPTCLDGEAVECLAAPPPECG